MKKAIIWMVTLSVLVSLCGCKHSSKSKNSITNKGNTASSSSYETDYNKKSSVSSETTADDSSNDNQSSVTSNQVSSSNKAQNNATNNTSTAKHKHYYTSSVTKVATCGEEGVKTYACSCGDSYKERIPKSTSHDWESATCTSPKKCKVCGKTEGEAKGHDFLDDGKCFYCDQMNPVITEALNKCSLTLPTLPKDISYYSSYSGSLYSTVKVTNITYKFETNNQGEISKLYLYFSGTKTYDNQGAGQSSSCRIGWKLYSPTGAVLKSDTFYSPNLAMGESFENKEENTYIHSSDHLSPGAYRLEILDVN